MPHLVHESTGSEIVTRLKRLGLGRFVRAREEVARDALLAACRNDKTITVASASPGRRPRHVALARAGLKITQAETFFIEPHAPAAETLKLTAQAA